MHFILEEEKGEETQLLRKFSPTEKLEGAIPTRIIPIPDTNFKFRGFMKSLSTFSYLLEGLKEITKSYCIKISQGKKYIG